jgi:ABC-2 type transport system ATP-binding protein
MISSRSRRRRRGGCAAAGGLVGAMLQDAGVMPGVRVGELLSMVRGLYPRPLPLEELAGLADLGSLLRRRADRLSGGQAQRVRFAAAIAGDPHLLVLDEPTAAMDVQARRNFWTQIRRFAGGAPCCSRPITCKRPTTRPIGWS